jgi:hypothetical protein
MIVPRRIIHGTLAPKTAQDLAYFTREQGKHLLERAAELEEMLDGLIGAIRPAA